MTWPSTVLEWVYLVSALITIMTTIAGINVYRNARRANMIKRYENIYAPMSGLFLTRHISSSQAILAPYWSQRRINAKRFLKEGKIFSALKALFDKRATKRTAEFEYGQDFPMDDILQILKGNEAFADETLLQLIRRADRSKYEYQEYMGDQRDGVMTDEEFELFNHIVETDRKLKRLFSPKS